MEQHIYWNVGERPDLPEEIHLIIGRGDKVTFSVSDSHRGHGSVTIYAGNEDSPEFSGFVDGAQWMLEKAAKCFEEELKEFNNLLCFIDKRAEGILNVEKSVEKFKQAMRR